MTNVSFAAEFPPTDAAAWRTLVETALKGADFDKRLVSRSYDGLRVEPLYPRAAGVHAVAGRAGGEPWHVMARADHPNAAEANKQALLDLENDLEATVTVGACPATYPASVPVKVTVTQGGETAAVITTRVRVGAS